jgi:cytochrome P450
MSVHDEIEQRLVADEHVQDPYPTYRMLRRYSPVHWSESGGCWLLSRYEDVAQSLRDPSTFSSSGRVTSYLDQLPAEVQERTHSLRAHFSSGLISSDPPDHTRVRSLLSRAFTARRVEEMRGRVQELVDEALDCVEPNGHMDVVADLAYPVPATVVAEMLGVPPEERERFLAWANVVTGIVATGRIDAAYVEHADQVVRDARVWLAQLIAERRASPRDDLFSALAIQDASDTLTETELLSTCVTLLVAGHETTTSLISSGLLLLLRNPDALHALRDADDTDWSSAVEEMLRCESPLQRNLRVAERDIEIHDQVIRRGERVEQLLGSANRDEDRFLDPERFDIGRSPNRHLAFGMGIHLCIGAPLARLEAPVALRTMIRRFPNLVLADEPSWGMNTFTRKLASLPVSLGSVALEGAG